MSGSRRPAAARGREVDPARLAASQVLRAVRVEDAYANLVLPGVLAEHGLTGRDAAFTTELVAGTLRWQGTYDAVVDACLDRPGGRVQAKVRDALRLGVHQLLGMRVPDHAAISTTVDLVTARADRRAGGFANAVLRRVAEHDRDGWVDRLAPDAATDPHGYAALAHAHPRWVVAELDRALRAHGRTGELADLLAADNVSPAVVLAARPGLADVAELEEAGGVATGRSPYAVTLPGGDPGELPAVAEGRAGVQDEGSQQVALALADADVGTAAAGRGEWWLDLCAGPGGKAALLAALAATRGARVVASEPQRHRARLVGEALRAVPPGTASVVRADGRAPAWEPGSFDRVLVDAPCTGLGALRRRPEARWRRRAEDLPALTALQQQLLAAAVDAARPGGVVVYATCSPVLAETREVVATVTEGRTDVALVEEQQRWPHTDGCDAMYWAVLRRLP